MTGSDDWWQGISGPQAEAVGDGYRVTFWWRDPAGSEETSLTKRVWIYITGVTDHHQNAVPQTLKRVPGTDAWQWQTTLSPAWRGSYCFIPSDRDDDFAPEIFNGGSPDRTLLREGWRRLLPRAIADPLNPQSWKGGRGHAVSALELPLAPEQPGWSLRIHLINRQCALNGTAPGWVTRGGYGFTPPVRPLPQSVRWRCCLMASSGPRVCRFGPHWPG
jgi:enterochelin esterase family protein